MSNTNVSLNSPFLLSPWLVRMNLSNWNTYSILCILISFGIYIYIYIYFMEYRLQPWVSWIFFCKTTIIRQLRWCFAVQKMFCKKLHETQGRNLYSMNWIYIYLIYIYLLLLYNSSILDIEHSLYYIALGSTHTYKVI